MAHRVLVTEGAERDLETLYDYLLEFDSRQAADHVLDRLLTVADSLADNPERGTHPRELLHLGIREYRQVSFKPYRVIYRVLGDRVVIYLIADGRRDMQTLLATRLLRT
ncbi:plasmid stabilization protein [Thioalkalivibrio denitrificans]|uniref:Plasmid stabilization protein n=1 Tax=Thioalkalivibrio denitrificans TaxID=108003 RepID=A0A1V3ND88_9GAMM|nr:type II toxin-antitoxin system RelE/ParE family toxin [Thioalkalivibrio denitrificans]OOG22832.1 plasmid stabilization protein [Thioalkalivibrio denitrificans]